MVFPNYWLRAGVAVVASMAACTAQAAFVVTVFGASQWGASDVALNVAGYTIENFEETTLVAGLKVSRLKSSPFPEHKQPPKFFLTDIRPCPLASV